MELAHKTHVDHDVVNKGARETKEPSPPPFPEKMQTDRHPTPNSVRPLNIVLPRRGDAALRRRRDAGDRPVEPLDDAAVGARPLHVDSASAGRRPGVACAVGLGGGVPRPCGGGLVVVVPVVERLVRRVGGAGRDDACG
jgi:hypothetical protein